MFLNLLLETPARSLGPQSCWVPWEHPEKMLLDAKRPKPMSRVLLQCTCMPDYRLNPCLTCPDAVNLRKSYHWGEAGESRTLLPVTGIALDGNAAHPDPGAAPGIQTRGSSRNAFGVRQQPLREGLEPVSTRPSRPGGFIYIREWPGLVTIPHTERKTGPANLPSNVMSSRLMSP